MQKDRPSSILITIVMDDKNNVEDEHSNIENMTPEELEKWIEMLRSANRCCNDNSNFVSQNCENAQQKKETREFTEKKND